MGATESVANVVFAAPDCSYHHSEYDEEMIWVPRGREDLRSRVELGVPCLLLRHPGASRIIVFFHANAEDLGQCYWFLRRLKLLLEVHVLAMEYPGYGICSGEASEESVIDAAMAVRSFVVKELAVPPNRVLFVGRSVGGGPAIHMATTMESMMGDTCAGLVTLSTYSNIQSVVGNFAGWGGWFPDVFNNYVAVRRCRCNTLIIHGNRDTTVNVEQAHELAEQCGQDLPKTIRPKVTLRIRPDVGHNDLDVEKDIVGPMKEAFPDLKSGPSLSLAAAYTWLRKVPTQLAPDVAARVPYNPSWRTRETPRGRISAVYSTNGMRIA